MYYDVEKTKRRIAVSTSKTVPFRINYTVLDNLFKTHFGRNLSELSVPIEEEEILLGADIVNGIFDSITSTILNEIKKVMQSLKPDDISMIILVGGFANCESLLHKVQQCFSSIRVIVPVDAGLSVLLGAVLFGHSPLVITSRVTRKTYGVVLDARFNEEKHPISRKFYYKGTCYCSEIFSLIVTQNESILFGTRFSKEYTAKPKQHTAYLVIATSNEDLPEYYNVKSCRKIGTLEIKIPNPSTLSRTINVDYTFGDTELIVVATEKDTNIKFEAKIVLD
jgi:molecular chaperone DnaK (HSP70)